MLPLTSREIVEHFWELMNTNDFHAVGEGLHDEYVLDWPQSGERVRGRVNFVAVNEHYPVAGPWRFEVQTVVAETHKVVTVVLVTAPTITTRVITFSEVRDGKIVHQTEYWPEPFEAAAWRAQWVERLT